MSEGVWVGEHGVKLTDAKAAEYKASPFARDTPLEDLFRYTVVWSDGNGCKRS